MRRPSCLVDTNVLLRLMNKRLPDHGLCTAALGQLRELDFLLFFSLQNAAEFWNVSTRPFERNGLGLAPAETSFNLKHIIETMNYLPDDLAVFTEWRRLVSVHQIRGVQVHDARLAASMIVHDVPEILTLNVADFGRFSEIRAVHPASLLQ